MFLFILCFYLPHREHRGIREVKLPEIPLQVSGNRCTALKPVYQQFSNPEGDFQKKYTGKVSKASGFCPVPVN